MNTCYKTASISALTDRKAKFIASDESVDRMGDVIRASGWQLDEFKSNPVLLWGHDSTDLPIGLVDSIKVVGKQLIADVSFATEEMNPFAEKVYQLVKAGIVNAVSVGFSPIEYKERVGKGGQYAGIEFIKQSLHELSVVTVPANANALAIAKSLQMSERDMKKVFSLDVIPDSIKREHDLIAIARAKARLCAC